MKKLSPLTKAIIIFFLFGGVFGLLQNTFYGYIDAEGVIHDSLFLPLSIFCLLIALILLIVKLATFIVRKVKK